MNAPSRSPNATVRTMRPQRPLPPTPLVQEPKKDLPRHSYLVEDDNYEPFQLLESHPLSLICLYHNVKRVSLEEGVPPPFKLDVPVINNAMEDPDSILPTHVLAVYDQDTSPEQTAQTPSLSPHTAGTSSGLPSLPATPLMIPVNAELWALYFTSPLSSDPVPTPSPPYPTREAMRWHTRADSIASYSSQSSSRTSLPRMRPRSVLSLPVHVVRVPSAKALPLLLLSGLRILPQNRVMAALLPRSVLAELPAPPAILAELLLIYLYKTEEGWYTRSPDDVEASLPVQLSPGPRSPRLPPPSLSPSLSPRPTALRRLSSTSTSSLSSESSRSAQPIPEPICALSDHMMAGDPDLRLINLAQQNFGLWANSLALGVKDQSVIRLMELAWSVVFDARRTRFGDLIAVDATGGTSSSSSLCSRQGRSRRRPPIPIMEAPPKRPTPQTKIYASPDKRLLRSPEET